MWLLALLSCVGLMICGTPAQGDPPNGDELQLTTQPVVTAAAATTASTSLTGSGTESDPYLIQSAGDMLFLSTTTDHTTYWDSTYYKLTKSITVVTNTWTPIGDGFGDGNNSLDGFDGQGYAINLKSTNGSAITITSSDGSAAYFGLFGYSDTIENLVVNWCDGAVFNITTGASLTYCYVGGVVGYMNGNVLNVACSVGDGKSLKFNVSAGRYLYLGGIAGKASTCNMLSFDGKIDFNTSAIDAEYIGGIIGVGLGLNSKFVGGIYDSGTTSESGRYVGGVVGITYDNINCCIVDLTGANLPNVDYFGGIVGYCASTGTIEGCYFDSSSPTNVTIGSTSRSGIVAGTMYGDVYSSVSVTLGTGDDACKYDPSVKSRFFTETKNYQGTEVALDYTLASTFAGNQFGNNRYWTVSDGYYPELRIVKFSKLAEGASDSLTGSGTESNPYLIQSAGDMLFLVTTPETSMYYPISSNVYYKLTQDITITTDVWTPIGAQNYNRILFDGGGHKITLQSTNSSDPIIVGIYRNLNESTSGYALGLFGYVGHPAGGGIKNLVVNWASGVKYIVPYHATEAIRIAGVAGYVMIRPNSGVCQNISCVIGSGKALSVDTSKGYTIGGVVGFCLTAGGGLSFEGNINCTNSTASVNLGGVAGGINGGGISNAKFVGKINATLSSGATLNVGGIVHHANGDLSNCFVDLLAGSNLTNINKFGGIVCEKTSTSETTMMDCYFNSNIAIGSSSVSGSIASTMYGSSEGTITLYDCKYKLSTALSAATNNTQGTADSSLNLKSASTFDGWNTNVWTIENGSYPELNVAWLTTNGVPDPSEPPAPPAPTTTSFTVTFENAPNCGLILYIVRPSDSGGYSEIRQYYFEGAQTSETIEYELTKEATYKILISKPYVWNFEISGTSDLSGTMQNGQFTFTVPAAGGGTVTITASGGTPPDSFIVV